MVIGDQAGRFLCMMIEDLCMMIEEKRREPRRRSRVFVVVVLDIVLMMYIFNQVLGA
jgi:hypothetical protein